MYNYNPYQNLYQQPVLQQPRQTDDRIWVQNKSAAESYIVNPGSFVRLWDSNEMVFYEKHTDNAGRPYMEAYSYQKVVEEVKPKEDYTLKIEGLEKRINELERKVSHDSESNSDDAAV